MAGQQVEVRLSVLRGHEDVDDGVGARAQVDQDVAQQEPEVVRRITNNLKGIQNCKSKKILKNKSLI